MTAPIPPSAALQSAVYEGSVRHRRYSPHPHAFRYQMAQLFIDLDEIDHLFDRRWLWSSKRRNLAEFRRSDFLGDPDKPLAESVRDRAQSVLGRRPDGPIRLLTHLRYFGVAFNPVSFYYCYRSKNHHATASETDRDALDCIVAEITNTPWRERHAYVLPVDAADHHGRTMHWSFDKRFHVSPFMPMDCDYRWRFTTPADSLHIHMDVLQDSHCTFDATLNLQRRALDAAALRRVLWRYPMMTLQVLGAIHWQALRLWMKHNPTHDHPGKLGSTGESR